MTTLPRARATAITCIAPMLDLTGKSEGTDKGRGYNETLGYGVMLDGKVTKGKGPTVDLVSMTLDQVEALQTRMLKNSDNKRLNSSAIGRYQVIRTTLRAIASSFAAARQDEKPRRGAPGPIRRSSHADLGEVSVTRVHRPVLLRSTRFFARYRLCCRQSFDNSLSDA